MLVIAMGIIVVVGVLIPFVWGQRSVTCPKCGGRASGPHFKSAKLEKYVCTSCGKIVDRPL
jgi:transposase